LWSEFDAATLKDLDSEGRCIVTDHGLFVLFNVYMPNAPMHAAENGDTNAAARMEFKLKFQRALQLRTEALVRAGRHVIIVGDVNACHQRIDHADFSSHAKKYKNVSSQQQPMQQQQLQLQRRQPSPTTNKEEEVPFEQHRARAWLHTFLVDGGGVFVDVFRRFYPDRLEAYTCWNTKTAARHSNYGTRIDYVLADQALVEKGFFTACDIRPDIHCSDHCPVQADLRIDSLCDDPARPPPPLCSRFMPEFAGNQQTLQSFFSKATAASTTAAAAAAAPPRSASAAASSSPSASAAGSRSGTASLKRPLSVGAGGSASASASVLSSGAPAKKAKTTIASLNKAGKNSAAAGTPSLRSFFGGAPKPATAAASSPFRTGSVAAAATTPQSSFDAAPAGSGTEDVPTFASSIYGNSAPSSRAGSPVPTSTPFESSGAVLAAAGGGGASAPSSSSNSSSSSAPSAWAALLNQKSVAVTCRCGLQAKLLSVNKAGANQGRKFYICPLPDGPQRCDFFLWAAQRQSKGGGGNGNGAGTR
jgi:AP endonuclease-2